MKTSPLLPLLFILFSRAYAAPCTDFTCDSITVQEILDANGLNAITVNDVAGVHNNRIDSLNLTGRGIRVLPAAIENLSSLRRLYLGCIRFSGVPKDPIYNFLDSIPGSIGKLSELTDLDLDGNNLTKLPQSITELKKLIRLNLEYNKITSLPSSIGELTELDYLTLAYNPITALPDEIGALKKLRYLSLYATEIQKLPSSIGSCGNLQYIIIANTGLETLPDEFGNLTSLVQAELYRNKLTSLPESIVNLKNLQYFFVRYNRLCSVPEKTAALLDKFDPGWITMQDCSGTSTRHSEGIQPRAAATFTVKRLPGSIAISLNLPKSSPVTIMMYNAQGRQLFKSDYGHLAAGVHHLKLRADGTMKGILFVRISGDFINLCTTVPFQQTLSSR